MKWFKHDSDAHRDAKLKRIQMKYGMEGYGLYWHCIELIAGNVDQNNITFELDHDAEIIAHDTGIHYELVQEMMEYMVNLGLFENDDGVITCLKLAKRLDQSMTSNPHLRGIIKQINESGKLESIDGHDSVMTQSTQNQDRSDKTRLDKKKKYTDDDLSLANKMFTMLEDLDIGVKKPNLETWASEIRLIRERDDRTLDEITEVFTWANNNEFWQGNIRSPAKLRKQWPTLISQMKRKSSPKLKSERELVAIGLEKEIECPPGKSNTEYAQIVKKELGIE